MKISPDIKESVTLTLAETARRLKAEGRDIISLAIGEPDFKTPAHVLNATKKALDEGYTGYSTPQGLIELRKAISKDYKTRYNASYATDEIIIMPGAKNAIFTALAALLLPGDEVIVISPYYVSYPPIIKLTEPDSKIIDIPLNADLSLPLDKIRTAINTKTKLLILNYPNNPTGQILSLNEVKEIVQIVQEHHIYLLADEIYDQVMLEGTFYSFSSFPEIKDQLIVINGYSKPYAMTGFRIGYALASIELIKRMNILNQNMNTNTNTFVQRGCLAIYENPNYALQDYLVKLKAKVDYLHTEVSKMQSFNGIKPVSTFYYFLDISPTKMDSFAFSAFLLEKYGVVVTPGIAFGKAFNHYVRLSLSVPLGELKKAVAILKQLTF